MELIFREDIYATGDRLRFGRGERRDYPRATWDQIARSVGKPLSDFTLRPGEVLPSEPERKNPKAQGKTNRKPNRAALKE